ncbi:hypothetical protein LZ32DRAFT_82843 [Colletotrichum eremochloae]|nr:hypothetical protein LZ32DRAFT_82843 [Colletotrichum eremochloae]
MSTWRASSTGFQEFGRIAMGRTHRRWSRATTRRLQVWLIRSRHCQDTGGASMGRQLSSLTTSITEPRQGGGVGSNKTFGRRSLLVTVVFLFHKSACFLILDISGRKDAVPIIGIESQKTAWGVLRATSSEPLSSHIHNLSSVIPP